MSAGAAPPPSAPYLPLLAATFVIAVSGLVYELIAGTVSSYLLGDSVYQFSLVIGLFMTAMGLGAFLSRYVEALEKGFVLTQVALGLVGGFSAPILFIAFALLDNYEAFLFLVTLGAGTLVGLEIPLVTRILQQQRMLRFNISNILTVDYIGALVAAVMFPLVLVPQLGLVSTSLVFGLLNLLVGALAAWLFRGRIGRVVPLVLLLAILACAAGLAGSGQLVGFIEARLYDSEIVLARQTRYQRIVVTRAGARTRLFLNGNLQFDSADEYRYHESLVHPVMGMAPRPRHVLVLGGGDGMAVREVLRHEAVESITLVDLDPEMTRLFADNPWLAGLNGGALGDPRVEIVNDDAWAFLKGTTRMFDVVILDLPDPHTLSVSKLYSRAFYADLVQRLSAQGLLVTQATSPFYAREAFWSIEATLALTGDPTAPGEHLETLPYHAYVPSFGEWGFIIAGPQVGDLAKAALPGGLRYLTADALAGMTRFPPDMARIDVEPNTILEHRLVGYYEEGWGKWFR